MMASLTSHLFFYLRSVLLFNWMNSDWFPFNLAQTQNRLSSFRRSKIQIASKIKCQNFYNKLLILSIENMLVEIKYVCVCVLYIISLIESPKMDALVVHKCVERENSMPLNMPGIKFFLIIAKQLLDDVFMLVLEIKIATVFFLVYLSQLLLFIIQLFIFFPSIECRKSKAFSAPFYTLFCSLTCMCRI